MAFLAIYVGGSGGQRAALIAGDKLPGPFGVDEFELGLPDYDGEPVLLVEVPEGKPPVVVDVTDDAEVEVVTI